MKSAMQVAKFRDAASDVLCSDGLSKLVELVCWSPEPDVYEARSVDGHVTFRRQIQGSVVHFTTDSVTGRNPLAVQDPARFTPLEAELASLNPQRSENSYPYAFEHVAQLFDHPCAPDLCVLHTSSHKCEDHRGEHGSLGVVQARAPFVISGAGFRHDGLVDRHCRLVDIAPTMLASLGVTPRQGIGPSGTVEEGLHLSRQDGTVISDLLDPSADKTRRVVAFLMDGTNANMLYDMAEGGSAPTIARLIEDGTAFAHGAIASLPTVTLPNHTTLLTGCHPGHHGVLHNAWYDRALGRQVVTESAATWQEAMRWLAPGIQTVHEALSEWRPGTCTISINEPADRGASYSTFELIRSGRGGELAAMGSSRTSPKKARFLDESSGYKWGTAVDSSSVAQVSALFRGEHPVNAEFPDARAAEPAFIWVNTSLTDTASHEAGPHSEMARAAVADTDARIGEVIGTLEETLGREGTTFVVVADHGMELNDPEVTGDWGHALTEAGIPFRDEAGGFLYFGDELVGGP